MEFDVYGTFTDFLNHTMKGVSAGYARAEGEEKQLLIAKQACFRNPGRQAGEFFLDFMKGIDQAQAFFRDMCASAAA